MAREHPLINKLRRAVRNLDPQGWEDVEPHINAIAATAIFPSGERFRHEKRGTVYDVYGVGHANSAREFDVIAPGFHRGAETRLKAKKVLFDRDEVVIYRDVQSGAFSVRGKDEFLDGRFTLLPSTPGQAPVDPARALVEPVAVAAPSPTPAPPKHALETDEVRVHYSGSDRVKYGQKGKVHEWVGGEVWVIWDDPEVMGGSLLKMNVFHITVDMPEGLGEDDE